MPWEVTKFQTGSDKFEQSRIMKFFRRAITDSSQRENTIKEDWALQFIWMIENHMNNKKSIFRLCSTLAHCTSNDAENWCISMVFIHTSSYNMAKCSFLQKYLYQTFETKLRLLTEFWCNFRKCINLYHCYRFKKSYRFCKSYRF